MARTVKAHFDGKVLVPDEPVDLPVGQPLELTVHETAVTDLRRGNLADVVQWIESLPPVDPSPPADLAAQHDHYLYGTPKRP